VRDSRLVTRVPRRPREEVEGGIYHVYARGNDRGRIYRDDIDRICYLEILAAVIEETSWSCLSYCLMDNHLHLLLETPKPNLASGIRRLHGDYGRWFNDRHDRSGHLFQGRYGAKRIKSESQLWATIAYIVRNPVESGACERPDQWRWSSHRAVAAADPPRFIDVDRLLWHLGGLGGDPRSRYQELTTGIRSDEPLAAIGG
jgi:putative transposase